MLMMKIVLQLRNVALVFMCMRIVTGTSNLSLNTYKTFLNKIKSYSTEEVDLTKVIQQLQQFVPVTNVSLEMDLRNSSQNVVTFMKNI